MFLKIISFSPVVVIAKGMAEFYPWRAGIGCKLVAMDALLAQPALVRLADATRRSAWSSQLWLVGGCVRDAMLGRPLKNDFDLVLEGDAVELVEWLHSHGVLEHAPVVFPRFGTAMARVAGSQLEFVTARTESYDEDSRKPVVQRATLVDDARRRDFTCNALMLNLHSGQVLDLLGRGEADLRARLLRTPLDPRETFFDDPLRILRAVRFKAQLDFNFDEELESAIVDERPRLAVISIERIRDEFVKTILLPQATSGLRDLMRLGLFAYFAPEFELMVGVTQGKWHHLDVWDHTLLVLENAGTDDLILALACLLHDVAKPETRLVDEDGQIRFFSHENVGAAMATAMMRRLKFDNQTTDAVALLVKNHMRLSSASKLSAAATRRLIRDLGEQLDRLLDLVDADARALKPGVKALDIGAIREHIESVRLHTPAEKIRSPLTGWELMNALEIEPGPLVGKIQRWLTEQVIEGQLDSDDKANAHAIAKEYLESLPVDETVRAKDQ